MPDKLTAPWDQQTVDALNRFQASPHVHPFTCREPHPNFGRNLVATKDGWICQHCSYTQDWAHPFMTLDPNGVTSEFMAGDR